jgi:hypothetical protein
VQREKVNPDGLLFTIRKTIPYLKQLDVSEQQIQAIAVENPKRFFAKTAAPLAGLFRPERPHHRLDRVER